MKNLKVTLWAFIAMFVSMIFAGCSPDPEPDEIDTIVGTWVTGGYDEYKDHMQVTFDKKGNFAITFVRYENGKREEEVDKNGTYKKVNDIVELSYRITGTNYHYTETLKILVLTKDRVVVEDSSGEVVSFKKI